MNRRDRQVFNRRGSWATGNGNVVGAGDEGVAGVGDEGVAGVGDEGVAGAGSWPVGWNAGRRVARSSVGTVDGDGLGT